ncbi:MAG: efflux RND transporter permease subunit [Fuerstiella sp.]
MNFIARITADHPLIGWCFVALLSLPPALGFRGCRIAESVPPSWVPAEAAAALIEAEANFSLNAPLVLVLEDDDFFRPKQLAAVRHAAAEISEMPFVRKLVWFGDIPEVSLLRGRVTPILPNADGTAEELATARSRILEHPLASGSLISEDGTTMVMLLDVRGRNYIHPIRSRAAEILEPAGIRVRGTGPLALHAAHDRALAEDHHRIQLMAYSVVGLLAVLMFRRPAAIFIAGSGPTVAVVWTMGWLQLIGQAENELAKIILPVLITMVGFADGMHLVVRIRQLRASGESQRDAVYRAVQVVGPACLLTSITTAIGFGSLMLSSADMISGFGRVSVIGVVVTFFSVVLITPLLANSWLSDRMHIASDKDPVTRLMNRCTGLIEFSSRHATSVAISGIVITVLCVRVAAGLIPDDRLTDRVPRNSEACQTMRDCDEVMNGIRSLRVVVSWDESKGRNDVWPVIEQCEAVLVGGELVGKPRSIRTCLSVFRGSDKQNRSILASQLPDELRNQFYQPQKHQAQIVTGLRDRGISVHEPMFARIEAQLDRIKDANPGFELEMVSDVIIEGRVVRQVVEELVHSLLMASVIIFAVLAIAFRSLRFGLISILPNVMPLAAAGTLRFMINDSLGIASACSFAICLGIAVDDTIHFLTHYREQRRLGRTPAEANRDTFLTVGSALVMTTVVCTLGLGTVLTSQMPTHVNFAAMGCTTLAAALVADLVFLPALLCLFPGKVPDVSSSEALAAESDMG